MSGIYFSVSTMWLTFILKTGSRVGTWLMNYPSWNLKGVHRRASQTDGHASSASPYVSTYRPLQVSLLTCRSRQLQTLSGVMFG